MSPTTKLTIVLIGTLVASFVHGLVQDADSSVPQYAEKIVIVSDTINHEERDVTGLSEKEISKVRDELSGIVADRTRAKMGEYFADINQLSQNLQNLKQKLNKDLELLASKSDAPNNTVPAAVASEPVGPIEAAPVEEKPSSEVEQKTPDAEAQAEKDRTRPEAGKSAQKRDKKRSKRDAKSTSHKSSKSKRSSKSKTSENKKSQERK